MFKHIVMWRFIDGANGKSKQEHALWAKESLEALVGVVPEIISLEVGMCALQVLHTMRCWCRLLRMPRLWNVTRSTRRMRLWRHASKA